MSRQTFPQWCDQPGLTNRNFSVDGSAVGASASTTGLDGRGKFLCTISKAANVVTINWVPAYGDTPYVFMQPGVGQSDTLVEIVSSSPQQFVYQTFTASTHAPLNDADIDFHVDSYDTISFVS